MLWKSGNKYGDVWLSWMNHDTDDVVITWSYGVVSKPRLLLIVLKSGHLLFLPSAIVFPQALPLLFLFPIIVFSCSVELQTGRECTGNTKMNAGGFLLPNMIKKHYIDLCWCDDKYNILIYIYTVLHANNTYIYIIVIMILILMNT